MERFFTVLTFLLPFIVCSQSSYGVIGGVSNSGFSDGFLEESGFENVFGFHLGGFYEHELTKSIALRPKLLFSQQGDRKQSDRDLTFPLSSLDYKLDYITIPLTVKFFSKPYIVVGPQLGFLISSKKDDDIDLGDVRNKTDYGLTIGFGYDFKPLFIELNAYQGLQTLFEFENQRSDFDIRNSVIQFSLGYRLN